MKLVRLISCSMLIFAAVACKHNEAEYHSLKEKIDEESKSYHDPGISSEAFLGDINTIEITEGGHSFLIPERKSQMQSYACSECHNRPLEQMQQKGKSKRAHWDIELNHANSNAMNCATCHNGNNMDETLSLTGNPIDFNRSYLLCAQCHNSQFEDWKGGAHGKNIGGWAQPRAAMTCVNCHNPHQPQIASKWPVRFNSHMEEERK